MRTGKPWRPNPGYRHLLVLPICLLLVAPLSVPAQTTGTVEGTVVDQSNAALPGVNVELAGRSLQGTRTAATSASGTFRFPSVPPGAYTITASLPGLGKVQKTATVSLDATATVLLQLALTASAEVTVSGQAPLIDSTSTTTGSSYSAKIIDKLPVGRNYADIVFSQPGAQADFGKTEARSLAISLYGSTSAENLFLIDGIDTTNVMKGVQGKDINNEFVEDVEVKTGGYQAEYGRNTGGVINVITKSGGNEFHGGAFAYYNDTGMRAEPDNGMAANYDTPQYSQTGDSQFYNYIYSKDVRQEWGLDLGGFLWKDRVWFFGAYDRVNNTTNTEIPAGALAGQIADVDTTKNLGALKLTYRMTDNQSLIASFFQDPTTDTGAINDVNHPVNGEPLTYLGRQERGGRNYALRYEGIIGRDWLVSGQVARHDEKNSINPRTAAGDVPEFIDHTAALFQTGGFGLIQDKDLTRDFAGASLTRFLNHHEIKFGAEYEKQTADVVKRMSGGQQVEIFGNSVNPGMPIYRHFYWTTPTATLSDSGGPALSALDVSVEHKNTTLYLQDRWSILPNLSVNGGIRWDRQEIVGADGRVHMDLKNDYAPRVGVIWDPTNEHRQKLFASYGRFYEQLPMDLVIRSYAFERQPRIVNYDPVSTVPDAAAESDFGTSSAILGGATEPTDPDIKGQFVREFIVGWEREVRPNMTLGVKGVQRDYGRVIEDFLCDAVNGIYCIGNPGRGIMTNLFALDYVTQFPAPRARRKFTGVQIDLTKRFSHRWQGLASYLWSKLDGNYDGEVAPYTNVGADPNISAAYDYYDFFTDGMNLGRITNTGPLSNDRRHQFKLSGVYIAPFRLQIGVSTFYRTGTPVNRLGYSDAYGRYEFFLDKRGTQGRTPDTYEMDVHLSYPLQTGKWTINFLMDVFNLFNTQRAVLLDQRWGFAESDNMLATPANPEFGKALLRTPPTSVRFGTRISF